MSVIYSAVNERGIGLLSADREEITNIIGRDMTDNEWNAVRPLVSNVIAKMYDPFTVAVLQKLRQVGMPDIAEYEDEDDMGFSSTPYTPGAPGTITATGGTMAPMGHHMHSMLTSLEFGGVPVAAESIQINTTPGTETTFALSENHAIPAAEYEDMLAQINHTDVAQSLMQAWDTAMENQIVGLGDYFDAPEPAVSSQTASLMNDILEASNHLQEWYPETPSRIETTIAIRDELFETYGDSNQVATGYGIFSGLPLVISDEVPVDQAWIIYVDNQGNETKAILNLAPESE